MFVKVHHLAHSAKRKLELNHHPFKNYLRLKAGYVYDQTEPNLGKNSVSFYHLFGKYGTNHSLYDMFWSTRHAYFDISLIFDNREHSGDIFC